MERFAYLRVCRRRICLDCAAESQRRQKTTALPSASSNLFIIGVLFSSYPVDVAIFPSCQYHSLWRVSSLCHFLLAFSLTNTRMIGGWACIRDLPQSNQFVHAV